MKNDKYAKKESEIESQYKWLADVEKKMSSLVEKWEPALITNNQIKEQVLTPISTTSKYYKPMIKATNWFAAKDIQLKWNEEAAKKGIPLNKVPKIREIWAERWKHLGRCEFTTNLKPFHLPTHQILQTQLLDRGTILPLQAPALEKNRNWPQRPGDQLVPLGPLPNNPRE
jgi:hypothetical protein